MPQMVDERVERTQLLAELAALEVWTFVQLAT
jgi:hypothetical protein